MQGKLEYISSYRDSERLYTNIEQTKTLLSFGFAITHTSVGPDDLCFDRYFKDTYNSKMNKKETI